MSEPELQDLLAQLARFFRANEASISAEQISKCIEHLSVIESSALDRLLCLVYRNKTPGVKSVYQGRSIASHPEWTLNSSDTATIDNSGSLCEELSVVTDGTSQNGPSTRLSRDSPSHTDHAREQQASVHSIFRKHDAESMFYVDTPASEEFDNHDTPYSSFGENTTVSQQPSSTNITTPLPASELVASNQTETASLHLEVNPAIEVVALNQPKTTSFQAEADDDSFSKTSLVTCSEITFTPSTERLLENCKTDRGEFLRAIREAKVAFPTGQGWEAAIATKKENADIRDVMKIYHRFECYNIYKHVVEAGFHTGTHWMREMRTELANMLCRRFPDRFQNQKIVNKCLNWVDQGCRYQEWANMFSEATDLGYLIALPSDVSHSAYTSRCTKEQMNTATLKFKSLGIDELVKNLELSELGNHIAATLRELTSKKRRDIDDDAIQSSRRSPRLEPNSSIPILLLQTGQTPTPPESIATGIDDHPTL